LQNSVQFTNSIFFTNSELFSEFTQNFTVSDRLLPTLLSESADLPLSALFKASLSLKATFHFSASPLLSHSAILSHSTHFPPSSHLSVSSTIPVAGADSAIFLPSKPFTPSNTLILLVDDPPEQGDATLGIALGVTFGALAVIGGVLAAIFVMRRGAESDGDVPEETEMGTTATAESYDDGVGEMGHEFVSPITVAQGPISDNSDNDDAFD
jgi:hypothetical protein